MNNNNNLPHFILALIMIILAVGCVVLIFNN